MARAPFLFALLVGAMASPLTAAAQTITGRVVDRTTRAPIAGAFVELVDVSGADRIAMLTDAAGNFRLEARGPGSYKVEVAQIGYSRATTPELTLDNGTSLIREIELSVLPFRLEEITAPGSGRCRIPRELGAQTHRLWEEARKALEVTTWMERDRGVPYQALEYERARNLLSLEIEEQTAHLRSGIGRRPFESISAEDLARNGYVRVLSGGAHRYFGPDAATLLSDPFLNTHCFRVRKHPDDGSGLIGLGFEPLPTQRVPEIEGVLWLDRGTLELRSLEFTFTRHTQPIQVPSKPFGGRVDFRRLANGAWVVERWWLRMPQMSSAAVPAQRVTDIGRSRSRLDELLEAQRMGVRVWEEGGVLRYMAEAAPAGQGTAAVQGVVFDSIRGMPLAGATVFLESVRRATVTDQAGRFRLEGLPEGTQRIAFMHPRADSLGISVRATSLVLETRKQAVINLFIPRGAACPTSGDDQGAVAGVVYDATNGEPLAGATVTVEWRSRSTADRGFAGPIRKRSVRAGTDGSYVICGFHLHQEISLRAKHPAGEARIEVDAARFLLQDFLVR